MTSSLMASLWAVALEDPGMASQLVNCFPHPLLIGLKDNFADCVRQHLPYSQLIYFKLV